MTGRSSSQGLAERVRIALDEVRPALEAEGGGVELLSVEVSLVRVRLLGTCSCCPMACPTLLDFVTERVRLWAPEIERVVAG